MLGVLFILAPMLAHNRSAVPPSRALPGSSVFFALLGPLLPSGSSSHILAKR